jgi:mono/diheme cytochrome c family protein
VVLALAGYGAAYYLSKFGGGFNGRVYEPMPSLAFIKAWPSPGQELSPRDLGKKIYTDNCLTCHQASGLGIPNMNPPLAGSEWVIASKPDRLIRIVLNGLQGPIEVKGAQYNANMFPFKDILKDEQIANVLTYIRSEWGNQASEVTPEEVAAVREQVKARPLQWTAPALLEIPVE